MLCLEHAFLGPYGRVLYLFGVLFVIVRKLWFVD